MLGARYKWDGQMESGWSCAGVAGELSRVGNTAAEAPLNFLRLIPFLAFLTPSALAAPEVGAEGSREFEAYNQAVALIMDAEDARRNGKLPLVMEKTGQAIEALHPLVGAKHPLAASTLAHAMYVGFRFEEAVVAYEEALKGPASVAHVEHAELGVSLCMLARFDEADKAFERALALAPADNDMKGYVASELKLLAYIVAAMGDTAPDDTARDRNYAVALEMYERALSHAPRDEGIKALMTALRKKLQK